MRKNLLTTTLLLLCYSCLFSACSTKTNSSSNKEIIQQETTNNIVADVTEENLISSEIPNTSEIIDSGSSNVSETIPFDDSTEEMVDWETWARQADNNEICIVVWNDKTNTQKVLTPIPEDEDNDQLITLEPEHVYTVQEGDRFAIPRRDSIEYAQINFEEQLFWESAQQQYIEFALPTNQLRNVYIFCTDKEYPIEYMFNY